MINYRIIRLTALHGFDAENYIADSFPNYYEESYEKKLELLFNSRILYSNSFSRSMQALGHEAYEIVWDFELLQKTWAHENEVTYVEEHWRSEIMMQQIRELKPDVIFLQGTEIAIPGRFSSNLVNANVITLLKEKFPFIRLVAMFSGFPTGVNRTKDVDVLFSCTPAIKEHYNDLGVSSIVCYHAFDTSLIGMLSPVANMYDLTFFGSSRAPESRYWYLRELLRKTSIKLWLNESEGGVDPGRVSIFSQSNIVKLCADLSIMARDLYMSSLYTGVVSNFRSLDPINGKFSKRVMRSQPYPSLSQKIVNRLAMIGKKIPVKSLRQSYPSRCQAPAIGLNYYQLLKSSKISFNRHADATGSSVGNMRMFEATGVGTCLLTDTGRNINELYEPGVEVVTYNTVEEAIENAQYLQENEEERIKIAVAGQKRTLRDHTFANRCQLIDEVISSR